MLDDTKIVKHYSDIFFETYHKSNKINKIIENLSDFAILLDNQELFDILNSQIIPLHEKISSIEIIASKSKYLDETKYFINILVENQRISLLEDILIDLENKLNHKNDIINVNILHESDLTKKFIDKIKNDLEDKLSKKVNINLTKDLSIMGGVIIKYNNVVMDYSLKNAITRIKNIL